jgi:hypothetical protein
MWGHSSRRFAPSVPTGRQTSPRVAASGVDLGTRRMNPSIHHYLDQQGKLRPIDALRRRFLDAEPKL